MRNIPISVLLTFPAPNYTDPQTQGMSLIVINAVFASLVVLAVVLRLYTRTSVKRWIGSDDVAIVVAAIFTLAFNASVMLANARYYWNRHIWDIPLNGVASVGKIAIAAKSLFVCASVTTRLSLLCFYYRLTSDTGLAKYRWVLHIAMAFNLAVFCTFLPLIIFLCTPVSAYWSLSTTGKCLDEGKTTLGAGIVNCFADLLITVLPIPMIMQLKMPLKQRLGVAILLGLGLIVTIAGIIRTYYIWKALMDSYDETWYAYPLWICAAVEIDLAVLCACAPTIRPLIAMFTRPIISGITTKYGKGSRSGRSTDLGALSSSASNALANNSANNTNLDHELEKIDAVVDIEQDPQDSEAGMPKRKWSKSWKKGVPEDSEGPSQPTKLVIMESQSFEVRHEARTESVGRPSQERYIRLDDTSHDLHNQWLGRNRSPADKKLGHNHSISGSRPRSDVSERAPKSKPGTPKSPFKSRFDAEPRPGREETQSPADDSFYFSQESDGDNSTPSLRSVEWPLQGASTNSSKQPLENGERRWDISRNPFQDARHS
ncbi:uncharacterized protein PV09_07005 [Verruconis gallopava]|uniref:Rhodopsin domain-containing protein n=1 Tax=Verruconis gallopava TaxID=253628 RepID=A0A0D1YL58_9PEZI|nr:uncharacterized protein PV09_07005 [Verruconis gallopava]KIW01527.1 hypothetical protein PV09_07005 [Verruconis gallopava]